jgi:hypothetical protein
VQVSLAGVGLWLRSLGRLPGGQTVLRPDVEPFLYDSPCGFGTPGQVTPATLRAMRHAAQFSATPARWVRPAMPPGSHPPAWP